MLRRNPVALRGDLQERSIQMTLEPIPKDERRPEREFWAEFEAARPKIFGALLDAVSGALRRADDVRLDELSRMADFAVWVTAAAEALGWEPGAFMAAYTSNRKAAKEALLEADPVAGAVMKLMEHRIDHEWSGTSEALLDDLSDLVSEDVKRTKAWPKAANVLSRRMKRLAPSLREAGIEYGEREEGREKKKIKTLKKIDRDAEEGTQNGGTEEPPGDPVSDEDEDDFFDLFD